MLFSVHLVRRQNRRDPSSDRVSWLQESRQCTSPRSHDEFTNGVLCIKSKSGKTPGGTFSLKDRETKYPSYGGHRMTRTGAGEMSLRGTVRNALEDEVLKAVMRPNPASLKEQAPWQWLRILSGSSAPRSLVRAHGFEVETKDRGCFLMQFFKVQGRRFGLQPGVMVPPAPNQDDGIPKKGGRRAKVDGPEVSIQGPVASWL